MRRNTIITLLLAIIVVTAAFISYAVYSNHEKNVENHKQSSAKERALKKAAAYQPPADRFCTQVMTPAVHKETGATYTFNTGCLPNGWKPLNRSDKKNPMPAESDKNPTSEKKQQEESKDTTSTEQKRSKTSKSTTSKVTESDTEAALKTAREFKPAANANCTSVMTPAKHVKTGVVYTFTSGCLPDGWVRLKNTAYSH